MVVIIFCLDKFLLMEVIKFLNFDNVFMVILLLNVCIEIGICIVLVVFWGKIIYFKICCWSLYMVKSYLLLLLLFYYIE